MAFTDSPGAAGSSARAPFAAPAAALAPPPPPAFAAMSKLYMRRHLRPIKTKRVPASAPTAPAQPAPPAPALAPAVVPPRPGTFSIQVWDSDWPPLLIIKDCNLTPDNAAFGMRALAAFMQPATLWRVAPAASGAAGVAQVGPGGPPVPGPSLVLNNAKATQGTFLVHDALTAILGQPAPAQPGPDAPSQPEPTAPAQALAAAPFRRGARLAATTFTVQVTDGHGRPTLILPNVRLTQGTFTIVRDAFTATLASVEVPWGSRSHAARRSELSPFALRGPKPDACTLSA